MLRVSILISAMVAVISALAAPDLAPSASTSMLPTGLRGTVVLSPSTPVCREDEPCTALAPGYVLAFRRSGRVVARATTRADGTYRVRLAPGRYAVRLEPQRRLLTITPATVTVVEFRVRRVDFEVDTGLQ